MKNLLLLTTLTLCLSFLATSCGEDDSFTVEELGPAFLEVTQDSLTFRFWLENEAGEITNVFSKEEHFVFAWSVTNNRKTERWMENHPSYYKNHCSVYNDKGFAYHPEFLYDDGMGIRRLKQNETEMGKSTLEGSNSPYPNLKKGKYYTLLQPTLHCYNIDTLNIPFGPEYIGSIEFPELRINFGLK